jgi:O-glycosyl hydrolase
LEFILTKNLQEVVTMKKSYLFSFKVIFITFIFAVSIAGCAKAPPYAGPVEQPHVVMAIHPETTYQTMTGFGAGFNTDEYIKKIFKPEDREQAYNLLYGPQENGTRLNIVRLVVSNTAQELSTTSLLYAQGFRYDWGGDPITQRMWSAIGPVRSLMKPIIYAVPFTPPLDWKIATAQNPYNPKCNTSLDPRACGGILDPNHYHDYARYLTDFADYYHRIFKVDIDVLSIQNEPGISAPWPSCIWSGEQMRDFLKILTPMLRARGLNTQMMLSEGTAWSGAAAHLAPTLFDAKALPMLGIMASHSYGDSQDPGRALFAGAWEMYKRPVWMSEMSLMQPPELDNPTITAALRVADYIHRDVVLARASVWIYCFAIFTYDFPGSMGVLSPADNPDTEGELIVPKRFWAMANFSQFVPPRWKVIKIEGSFGGIPLTETNTTGFISPQGDGYVIVAINHGNVAEKVTYSFGNWSIGTAVDSYCTSENYDLAPNVVSPAITDHNFTAYLPPQSVVTFKGSLTKP